MKLLLISNSTNAGEEYLRYPLPEIGRFLDGVRELVFVPYAAVTFSYAPGLSARFLIYDVSAALLVVITVSAVRNGEDLKRLCAGAAVCVGATGAYGIVQRIQGVKVNPSYVDLKVNAGMPGRVFSIFDNPNTFAQVLLLLLPLVVGITYEFNRWVGRHVQDSKLAQFLTAPGLWLQNFTTNEPDDSMIECAIRSLELVLPDEKGKDAW